MLLPQFPQEKLVISVYPPIRHHLMNEQGVYVTSPLVNNFTMQSNLGKIIQTAFPYLYSNPSGMPPCASQGFPFLSPYPPEEANRSITSLSVANTASSSTTSHTTAKPAAPSVGILSNLPLPVSTADASILTSQNGFGYKMPDVPDAFLELSELSVSQLTDMNEQQEFLTLPQLKQIITDKDDLVKLGNQKSAFEKQMQRHTSALQARLKVAAHEAGEEPDHIAEDFGEGKMEINYFLSSFTEKRTICYCRRAKKEKLQQAIAIHSQCHAPNIDIHCQTEEMKATSSLLGNKVSKNG
uniref:VPS37 C-terminal domain-containing protein n=1 Tax=Colobus angolensis palliatus TaxID=336983 RepID=A0A2K5IID5_COLAP